ncbi:hypothetical protein D3C86_1501620 [compost metagenome]
MQAGKTVTSAAETSSSWPAQMAATPPSVHSASSPPCSGRRHGAAAGGGGWRGFAAVSGVMSCVVDGCPCASGGGPGYGGRRRNGRTPAQRMAQCSRSAGRTRPEIRGMAGRCWGWRSGAFFGRGWGRPDAAGGRRLYHRAQNPRPVPAAIRPGRAARRPCLRHGEGNPWILRDSSASPVRRRLPSLSWWRWPWAVPIGGADASSRGRWTSAWPR